MTDVTFARLDGGIVVEVVPFDPRPAFGFDAGWVEAPADTEPGATYDPATGVFTAPPPRTAIEEVANPAPDPVPVTPPVPAFRKKLTPPEFKLQFRQPERIAIRTARGYAGPDPVKLAVKAALDDFYEILDDPRLTLVDLDMLSTIEGVYGLAAMGLITEERAGEILAGIPE